MDADERSTWFILSCVALCAYFLKALFIWSRIARGRQVHDAPIHGLSMLLRLLIRIYVDPVEENMHPLSALYQRLLTKTVWISTALLLVLLVVSD